MNSRRRSRREAAPVTQAEIDLLLRFEELIEQRWRFYDKLADGILRRLLNGAAVEPGQHSASVRRIAAGGQRGAWLVLNRRRALLAMSLVRSR
jgi:hypothetical protein